MSATCGHCGEALPDGARFCPACGRPSSPAAEPQAERRPVTVVFADAVGSTAFAERAGDEAAYRFVQQCVSIMTDVIERNGGTITQFRGDGVMALFGAPLALEDSAVRAVTAALELRDELDTFAGDHGCSFRIGLSTGPVVVGRVGDDVLMDYTAIGDTANVAARMEAAAEPGTVLLAESTWRAARDFVECESIGALDVKGKTEPIGGYRALRRRGVRTRLEAAIARGLGPFVGRTRELDLLLGHGADLASGHGQVIEITGEAGIGKSRLLLELRTRLSDGVGWLEGHCSASGVDTPYLPIADLLRNAFGVEEDDDQGQIAERVDRAVEGWSSDARRAVPYLKYLLDIDPGEDLAPDARLRRDATLDALRISVADAASRQPRVIVIEDVHWADPASLDAIDALAEVTAWSPVLLLVTARPGAVSPFGQRATHSRIALDGISDESTSQMLSVALDVNSLPPDLVALVARRADGNPLFVEELTATLLEAGMLVREGDALRLARPADSIDVPATLQDVILARIDRLAREARDALQLAAVIGREFTVRLLDRLAGLPEGLDETLAELRTLELIRQKAWFPELSYLFKHALTHEVTYGTLLDERRRALHRLVAQAIEDVYADRIAEHVETLAHHWSVAEEWPKALAYLEQAAESAADAFANEVASSFYEQAIVAAARCGEVDRQLALYQRLGDLCLYVGDLPRALDVLTRMAEVARVNDRPTERAWALVYLGDVRAYSHDVEGAIAEFRAAANLAGADPEPRFLGALGVSNVQWVFGRFEDSRASDQLVRALDDGSITHPRVVIGRLATESVRLRWQGRFGEFFEDMEREIPASTDLLSIAAIAWMRGIALAETGRFEAALDEFHRLLKRLAEIGEQLFYARSLNTIGWVRLELGDLSGCIDWNERCLSFLAESSIPDEEIESNTRLNLAEARFALGDVDAMDVELRRVQEITAGQPLRETWMMWRFLQRLHLLRAEHALACAKPSDAASHLAECLALARDSESRKYVVKHARVHARHHLMTHELEGAEQEGTRALELATALGHPSEQWRVLSLLAEVADARGDVDAARHHRRRADAILAGVEASLSDSTGRMSISRLRAAL